MRVISLSSLYIICKCFQRTTSPRSQARMTSGLLMLLKDKLLCIDPFSCNTKMGLHFYYSSTRQMVVNDSHVNGLLQRGPNSIANLVHWRFSCIKLMMWRYSFAQFCPNEITRAALIYLYFQVVDTQLLKLITSNLIVLRHHIKFQPGSNIPYVIWACLAAMDV